MMTLARMAPVAFIPLLLAGTTDAQAYDPAAGTSPLTLLAAPTDGVAYHEARLRARELFGAQKFAEAQPVLEQLARDYPRDPENWMLLGHNLRRLSRVAACSLPRAPASPARTPRPTPSTG